MCSSDLLYLLIKELLTNIAKHTNATSLRFEALIRADHFCLIIEDNGEAIANGLKNRNGHGRQNIKQRMEKLKAELDTEAMAPHGTRITIRARTMKAHPL